MNNESKKGEKATYLISLGAEIAGGAAGAAIGLIAANPILAVTLGAVRAGISKGLVDATEKYLSNREKVRTGAAAAQTIVNISERMKSGQPLRDDDFFDLKMNSRSYSEELFEGVLLRSKNEHEEKKVVYIANIFSNSVFLPISLGEANHILRIAHHLSYRQLCVLGLVNADKSLLGIILGDIRLRDNQELIRKLPVESISLRQEIVDLQSQGLIECGVVKQSEGNWSSTRQEDHNLFMLAWYDVIPAGLKLTVLGDLCLNLMTLNAIPNSDLLEVARLLVI
ncbi:hypothetical protein [Fictibacillus fluitans]|uniref:Uncharacterized protein n=1 Tax=Fictibacillus fluitans TaxID=3058422 RepID=A0ABT8HUG8_9BACL|nr:hypothetical protein [Fictibacillus sp. NE201]MDN4524414.1 hypothetical protein [Fictibacillus sp. NE201]